MENLKTPAHHQLHPCKPPHLQGCSECLDVKKTILAILENVQGDGFQDVQDLAFSNLNKVLNDVFFSLVRRLLPRAIGSRQGAREANS